MNLNNNGLALIIKSKKINEYGYNIKFLNNKKNNDEIL